MKLALVTGSARRLGGHLAVRLAQNGWAVALHASRKRDIAPEHLAALDGVGASYRLFVADLADVDAVAALIPQITAHFGAAVRLLVNNASRFDAGEGVPDMAALEAHFRVNAAAPFALAQAVAAQAGADARCVVNILDQRIRNPHGDQLAYTISKQALAEMTRTMAAALAPDVRVNGIAPGLTLPTGAYDAVQMDALTAMMPLQCLATPDDIADALLFLAGARATTGQVLFVDGGASLRSYPRDFVHLGK